MSVFWLQSAAWWGLAALAIPVLIHLLVRQQSRRLLFPSLKFLPASRLAALRRRNISDWLLLAVRMLILAAAVAACAAPVFVSAARRQSWNARVARAIVIVPAPADRRTSIAEQVADMVTEERAVAFVSAVFTPSDTVGDGLRDAADWLQWQPPASREVVVVGDLRDGSLAGADFEGISTAIGIRILPVASVEIARSSRLSAVAESTGDIRLHDLQLVLEDHQTRVEHTARDDGREVVPVELRAAAEDQARVEAALRAVLAEGVVLHRDRERRVVIEFDGASKLDRPAAMPPAQQPWMRRVLEQIPDVRGSEEGGRLLVRAGLGGNDPRALHLIARVTRTVFADDLRDLEPRVIPASTIAAWSRPAGLIPDDVQPGDEGDRRYFWLATLILLAVEHWVRRSRPVPQAGATAGDDAEALVA